MCHGRESVRPVKPYKIRNMGAYRYRVVRRRDDVLLGEVWRVSGVEGGPSVWAAAIAGYGELHALHIARAVAVEAVWLNRKAVDDAL